MGAVLAEFLFWIFRMIVGALLEALIWIVFEVVCRFIAVILVRVVTLNWIGFECWPPKHSRAIVLRDDDALGIGAGILLLFAIGGLAMLR